MRRFVALVLLGAAVTSAGCARLGQEAQVRKMCEEHVQVIGPGRGETYQWTVEQTVEWCVQHELEEMRS